jgi:GNAT superfamily N-acetyltransferase
MIGKSRGMPIHPVKPDDLPAIRSLIASAVRGSVVESEADANYILADIASALQAWLANPTESAHLKFDSDGKLVGVILVKRFWNLAHLFVLPSHQRGGVGRALVEAALVECRSRSPMGKLMVNSSLAGVGFYLALGFKRTGPGTERPGGCVPLEYRFEEPTG